MIPESSEKLTERDKRLTYIDITLQKAVSTLQMRCHNCAKVEMQKRPCVDKPLFVVKG